MSFRPLADRLLVRAIETEALTPGGIIIPDAVKDKPQRGEIVAMGPGARKDGQVVPIRLSVGDTIIFGKWSGAELKVEGEKFLIMTESDVMGTI